ncbi:flippase [bacterium]|nr:flippase [bacterium]
MKKNTYFLALTQAGQWILAFILIKVVAERLGDAGFGIYMFASVMSYFVLLLNDLGLVIYITREVAKTRDQAASLFSNGFVLKLMLLILSLPFLGVYLYISRSEPDKMWAVLAFGVFGLVSSFNNLCSAIYRGFERMEYEMVVRLFEKMLVAVFGIWFVLRGGSVVGLCLAFAGASIVSFIINLSLVRLKFLHQWAPVRWRLMKQILGTAIVFGLFWIITNIHERVDVLMLEQMTDNATVGWYTLAYRLIMVVGLIPVILMNATFPRISKVAHKDPEEVQRIYQLGMKYLMLIVLPLIVGVLLLSDEICLFFGSDFGPSGSVLRLLIFAAGVDFFSIFFAAFLMAWDQQKRLLWLQGGALCLNVIANFILIPHFQYMGAGIATLASRGLIFAMCSIWVFRRLRGPKLRALLFGIVSTGGMALFLWIWKGPLLIRIGLATAIYGTVIFLMGGIRPAEIFIGQGGKSRRE